MKTRERFQEIRSRTNRLSLRLRLTLLVAAELLVAVLVALGMYFWLRDLIPMGDSVFLLVDMILISLFVGMLVTGFLSRLFFSPIKRLREAMAKVADGDFSVRLPEKSSSKEILEVYSGFNMMAHELQATEILQTDFVSNVSHEIKTPISAIEGYSTLLSGSEGLTEDERIYVEKILSSTARLSELVGSILLLSKLENRQIPGVRSTFRLDEQIRQSIAQLEPAWEKRDTRFDVELARVDYSGNAAMLYHVWGNLIGNAIKFGPEGGTVRIRLETGGRLAFTVEDQGPGLSEEALRHAFDKFYQADSSHKQEGNGLGLALVKRIVALEDGAVTAENLPEGGCRFTVTLPARR